MRKFKSLLSAATTLAALVAVPACAQPAPQTAPAATPVADADPALWVVKDADTTIYLFGTVHVLKPGLTWFDEAVKTAFDSSNELVLEMVQPDAAAMQGIIMSKAMTAPGTPTLTDQVPEANRAAYLKAVTDLGAPPAALDRFKPWFAAVTFSLAPIQKLGYVAENGPEDVLSKAAKAASKPVSGLETAAEQIGFFDGLSQPAQVKFLTGTLDELPKIGETMSKMVDIWSRGNPDALADLMNESMKDSPEVAKILLADRNARWAEWMAKRMTKPGTVFVAVGAGHLAGSESVIAKLGTHKLTATRVKY